MRILEKLLPHVCIWALGVTTASAQGVHARFGVGIGRNVPVGAFHQDSSGEGFVGAWTATANVTLTRPTSRLGLLLDVGYGKNGANDRLKADLTSAFGQPSDESITLFGADASLFYPLGRHSKLAPAVFGGIGLWHQSISVTTGGASTSNSAFKLGWQLGAEVSYRAVFVQLRYVNVSAAEGFPSVSFVPLIVGIRFGSGTR